MIGNHMESWIIYSLVTGAATSLFGGVSYAVWSYYNQRKIVNGKVSDLTVIALARENGGKINVALLCEHTDLTAPQAKTKLAYLAENGVLATDWKQMLLGGGNYVLPNTQEGNIFNKFFDTKGSLGKRIEALFNINDSQETLSPTKALSQNKDAQIITLAVENKGVVSASAVCVKLNISIDEAQKRLEDLRQKQIFISEVGQNGGVVYRLLDS